MLDRIAIVTGEKAENLIGRFWPGPLTLVLLRRPDVARSVSAGLNTIAVRMPRNKIALELIKAADTPIAAPSANLSGRPSPTKASHVAQDLEGKVDLILDGGDTTIGIESTVLDVSGDPPVVLRPGWVSKEELSNLIGTVEAATSDERLRRSPGTRHRHYSPRAPVVLVERGAQKSLDEVCKENINSRRVGVIAHSNLELTGPSLRRIQLRDSAQSYARSIYDALRELDAWGADVIIVEGIDDSDEGAAVMDRLRRAAAID
jgi:L-threonylcarbamoyladenylate synthase